MQLTNRAQKRANALASQIHAAGIIIPCSCGLSGCYYKATPRHIADKIIQGQWKVLKLNDNIVKAALKQVQLI